MKTFLSFLILSAALAVQAQTNTPPSGPITLPAPFDVSFLTNLPLSTNLSTATFSTSIGVITKNGAFENELSGHYYLKTHYLFSGALQFSPSSAVMDNLSLGFGYRKPWANAEVYAHLFGRRTWSTDGANTKPSFQGGLGFGAAWTPFSNTRWQLGTELRLLTSTTGSVFNERPSSEIFAFTRWYF